MKRFGLTSVLLVGSVLNPTTGSAQISCSREGLKRAVDLHIATHIKGETSGMPLAAGLTTTGYWLFNADSYLKWSSSENWDVIPVNQRDTRDTLVAAANACLDAFLEGKKDLVPWGYPCNRTEGGAHTRNGSPTDSCDVGVPSG